MFSMDIFSTNVQKKTDKSNFWKFHKSAKKDSISDTFISVEHFLKFYSK